MGGVDTEGAESEGENQRGPSQRGGMGPETTRGLLYIKPPFYMSLRRMILDASIFFTCAGGRGLGPGNLELLPQMALAYWLDAISRGPENS